MRSSLRFRPVFFASIATSVLAACSGGQSVTPPSQASFGNPAVQPDAGAQPVVFTSVTYSQIDEYSQTGKNRLIKAIKGQKFAQGLAVDSSGDLFAANTYGPYVTEYAPPYKTVTATIPTAPNQEPVGVAVSKDGIVAVTSYSTDSGLGNVTFFAKGSTTACATIASADLPRPVFDGFDASDDLYVDGGPGFGSGVAVGEIKGACKAKKLELLTVGNSLTYPGGIKVDKSGNIAIMDQGFAPVSIYTYAPPKKHSLGQPISTTTLQGLEYGLSFAFTENGNKIFTSDSEENIDVMREYKYPAGGAELREFPITGGTPTDEATVPAMFPPT